MTIWTRLSVPPAPSSSPARDLAIGFVTYRPDPAFYERLPLAYGLGHEVFVFDNAPESTDHERLDANAQPRLHYSTGGKNLGLGIGLSVLCASAYAKGCKYLLFFDQDTRFTAETLAYATSFLERHATFLTSHVSVTLQAPHKGSTDHQPIDTLLTISSGSLFLLDNVARLGWHNPKYFVDGVDYEFCLRARSRQFKVATCSGAPGFDHVSDQADSTHKVFGRSMRLRKYPLSRVVDSLSAYVRLVFVSVGRLDGRGLWSVLRSLGIFVGGQCLARLLIRKSN